MTQGARPRVAGGGSAVQQGLRGVDGFVRSGEGDDVARLEPILGGGDHDGVVAAGDGEHGGAGMAALPSGDPLAIASWPVAPGSCRIDPSASVSRKILRQPVSKEW